MIGEDPPDDGEEYAQSQYDVGNEDDEEYEEEWCQRPPGYRQDQEVENLPRFKNCRRKTVLCRFYWRGGCRRGARCYFWHSTAHMTTHMKVLMSHCVRDVVLPGCPKPIAKDRLQLRVGYPAPWPLEGVT